tara:strand:+ start:14812 stop:15636 length:825 start_codon:yes stop_codon:yes gene_type:complete
VQPDTTNLKKHFDALTNWWEGAGVQVDRAQFQRMLNALNKAQAGASGPQTASSATQPARSNIKPSGFEAAKALAANIQSLDQLRDALTRFDGCELKETANTTVIADGQADADIMVIGEGPGRDEDMQGKPFVGRAGQLLDRMLASIGLSREENVYITNVNFWRPPGNRNPSDEELALCRPFVDKHISLIKPKLIIAAGAVSAKALLDTSDGIMRLRGKKFEFALPGQSETIPLYPILHPAYLLRRPAEKARAWADLLTISSALDTLGIAPQKRP